MSGKCTSHIGFGLDAYGELYGRVERKLFADAAAGRPAGSLKSLYLSRHGIPARMFNAIRISLDGKAASVKPESTEEMGDGRSDQR